MSLRDIVAVAANHIAQARLRFVLTNLGVIVAISTLVALVSFGVGLRRETIGNLETREAFTSFRILGARQSQSWRRFSDALAPQASPTLELNEGLVERLSRLDEVSSIQPELRLAVQLRNGQHEYLTRVRGAGSHLATLSPYSKIRQGRYLSSESGREIVLSFRAAQRLGFDPPGSAVGHTVVLLTDQRKDSFGAEELPFETVEEDFTVMGVLPRLVATRRNPLYWGSIIPLQEALRLWRRSVGGSTLSNIISAEQGQGRQFEAIDVRVRNIADLEPMREKVDLWGGVTFSIVDQVDRLRRVLLILEGILSVLGGIASVVAGLGIANVLVMSVLERIQVIGIMKSIGARDRDVRLIFLVEAGLIGVCGGLVGLMTGWALTRVGHLILSHYFRQSGFTDVPDLFSFPLWLLIGAPIFAILLSVICGLWPAHRAARVDPVLALRGA